MLKSHKPATLALYMLYQPTQQLELLSTRSIGTVIQLEFPNISNDRTSRHEKGEEIWEPVGHFQKDETRGSGYTHVLLMCRAIQMFIQSIQSCCLARTKIAFVGITVPRSISSGGGSGGRVVEKSIGDNVVWIKTTNCIVGLLTIHARRTAAGFEVDDNTGGGCRGSIAKGTFETAADVSSGMLMLE
jgi:hypothetical protein